MNRNWVVNINVIELKALKAHGMRSPVRGVVNRFAIQQRLDHTKIFRVVGDRHG